MEESPLRPAGRRILVVEDEADVSRAFAEMLEHLGYSSVVCHSAEEAFNLFHAPAFDLLLVDYRMPDMTGLDLVFMLRQEGYKVPVIIVTGHPATQDRITSKDLGVFAILKKPVSAPQLAIAIEETLKKASDAELKVDQASPA